MLKLTQLSVKKNIKKIIAIPIISVYVYLLLKRNKLQAMQIFGQ